MSVSNRILYGRRRNLNFKNAETYAVIAIWASSPIQQKIVDGCKYSIIYDEIANELRKEGFNRTGSTIRRKISNLRCRYYSEARSMNFATFRRVSTWPFWNVMHDAMSTLSEKVSLHQSSNDKDASHTVEDDHSYNVQYSHGTDLDDQSAPSSPGSDGGPLDALSIKRKAFEMEEERPSRRGKRDPHSCRPGRREANFTNDETRLLIHVWASEPVRRLFRTEPLQAAGFEEISRVLGGGGYARSGASVKSKIDNLKTMYYACVKRMEADGSQPSWTFWADMRRAMSAYVGDEDSFELLSVSPDIQVSEDALHFVDCDEVASPAVSEGVADTPQQPLDTPLEATAAPITLEPASPPSRPLQRKRSRVSNYTDAETRALIAEWASPSVQAKLTERRSSAAYEEVHRRLRQRGIVKPPVSVWKKVVNLKYTYYSERKALESGLTASSWPYWDVMHRAMTAAKDVSAADSSVDQETDVSVGEPTVGEAEEGEEAASQVSAARLGRGGRRAGRFARGNGAAFARVSGRANREIGLLQQMVDTDKRFLAIAERQLALEETSRAIKDRMMLAQTRFYDSFARLADEGPPRALQEVSTLLTERRKNVNIAPRVADVKPVFYKIVNSVPVVMRQPPPK